jgi:hypothetical protein
MRLPGGDLIRDAHAPTGRGPCIDHRKANIKQNDENALIGR